MLAPGCRVDAYDVLRLVALGAMCQVYEARADGDEPRVALKVLHGAWCSDTEIVSRFFKEVNILGSIRHANIVSLLSSGKLPDGAPYMVLEWLPRNLAHAIAEEGRLGAELSGRFTLQIALALTALHERGIVHRDLKPANILLDRRELGAAAVRLGDLGLAKVQPDWHPSQVALGHISTGGGAMLGTWDYMAPEQWIKSKAAEPASDIYSLGVILFQMLAGRLPFVADRSRELMALHLFEEPPMDRLPGATPPALRAILRAMLVKAPSARPRIDEVIAELRRAA